MTHGKRPKRARPPKREFGAAPGRRREVAQQPSAFVLTPEAAAARLGRHLNARNRYLIQLPGNGHWPVLDMLGTVHYVRIGPQYVVIHELETLRQLLSTLVTRGAPIIACAEVHKSQRGLLYQRLLVSPEDTDERDILVLDLRDPGPNPLLEATIAWADANPGVTE